MQVLCGLQGIFLLFNCQTPEQMLMCHKVTQKNNRQPPQFRND